MVNLLLKIFLKSRLTHEELLKKPDFQWKDPTIVWIAVPAKEKENYVCHHVDEMFISLFFFFKILFTVYIQPFGYDRPA